MSPHKLTTLGAATLAAMLFSISTAAAATPATSDVTDRFLAAGVQADGDFRAVEVGGIVVLRGDAADKDAAARASSVAQQLGYTRVANLIRVIEPPDDRAIARVAERELSLHRSLDGCQFRIGSQRGVVRLGGTVTSELQKDVAMQVVRSISGVRGVQSDLR